MSGTPEVSVEAELAALRAENAELRREIEHRVRNTLQVVSSLVDLTARAGAAGAEAGLLAGLQVRLAAMGVAYRGLDDLPHRARLNMEAALRELGRSVMASRADGRPGLAVEAAGVSLGLDEALPVILVVTEVMLEAEGAPVSVSLTVSGGEATLTAGRDGVAAGEALLPVAGRRMVDALARQLGGVVSGGVGGALVLRFGVGA